MHQLKLEGQMLKKNNKKQHKIKKNKKKIDMVLIAEKGGSQPAYQRAGVDIL